MPKNIETKRQSKPFSIDPIVLGLVAFGIMVVVLSLFGGQF